VHLGLRRHKGGERRDQSDFIHLVLIEEFHSAQIIQPYLGESGFLLYFTQSRACRLLRGFDMTVYRFPRTRATARRSSAEEQALETCFGPAEYVHINE
jgi:hypothetical protein